MPRKKEETIEDIIDRIEADLEIIRDKAMENSEEDEFEDEDEDEDENEDEDDE